MSINTITQKGIDLVKSFEDCKLEVYKDIAGLLTVGYGHRCPNMYVGDKITQQQADDWLASDLRNAADQVDHLVTVSLSDDEYSALVSFVYNLGSVLKDSTLLSKLNSSDYDGAAKEFLRWDHSSGKVIPGLLRRREAEMNLFLGKT